MGQANAKRIQVKLRETVTVPASSTVQPVAKTCFFEVGDLVDVVDVDANGNILSTLADNLTIVALALNASLTLSASVDTTAATGTPMIVNQKLDDAQEAIERALCHDSYAQETLFDVSEAILAQALNSPAGGQTTFQVADSKFWRAGDVVDILADEGVVQQGVTILSVNPLADLANNRSTIVVNAVVDTSTFTNPYIQSTDITVQDAVERNQQDIDSIDAPVENEDLGDGNGTDCAFETANLFKIGTSKVFIDGIRKKLGTAGTRASLTQGAGNSQLIYTSMLLGLLGNEIRVRVVSGAGLTISVTKTFKASASGINTAQTTYDISINDNGGAATAAQIAAALNASALVKRLVQVQYGGTGAGVVSAFAYTALSGGLNNGTGDYAEIPQILNNLITSTGMKWVSFWIIPADKQRMNEPPQDDEEQTIDYRKILVNA
jgi:hypothetical protein